MQAFGVFSLLVTLFMVCWANGKESWPHGVYGLPRAKTGCPDDITWKEGWRKQDLEEKSTTSSNIHMDVQLQNAGNINRTFCMKTVPDTMTTRTGTEKWPQGFYCIYKARNSSCPTGMTQGAVKWDDNDITNTNQHGGVLPDGVYDSNTKINYCCQEMGKWFDPIELPIDRPFYLLPHNNSAVSVPRCQLVKWAMSWLEYIDYDTEDFNPTDTSYGDHVFFEHSMRRIFPFLFSTTLRVHYCYYKDCRYTMKKNEGVFGATNGNPRFEKCSWSIEVKKSHVISIQFTQLRLPKCQESYLAVYDGVDEKARLLEKYCDLNRTRQKIVSTKNHVFVILKSLTPKEDFSSQPKFEIKYIAKRSPVVISSGKPTNQSRDDNPRKQSPGSKSGLIITVVVVTIFILIIAVLLVIFRAKVFQFLEKLCCRACHQAQGEPATNVDKNSTENREVAQPDPDYVNVFVKEEQNMDEGHYTDLNGVSREPENIYQSLEHPRRALELGNDQNTDYEITA